MIITLNNTSGYISKRVKLGNDYYNLVFTYNFRDNCWYISNGVDIVGKRVCIDRPLMTNDRGTLYARNDVSKTGFTTLEWVAL